MAHLLLIIGVWCVCVCAYLLLVVIQDLLMDILRVLSSPALEVRKKTLGLVLDLVNSRNVEEVCFSPGSLVWPCMFLRSSLSDILLQVVMVLKKEVVNSSNGNSGESNVDNNELASYRQCLVRTLHSCSVRFTSVAPAVVPLVSNGDNF